MIPTNRVPKPGPGVAPFSAVTHEIRVIQNIERFSPQVQMCALLPKYKRTLDKGRDIGLPRPE